MAIKRLGLISMLIVLAVAGLLVVTSCGASPHKAGEAVYDEVAPSEPGYSYTGGEAEEAPVEDGSKGSSNCRKIPGSSKVRHVIRTGS